MYDIKFVPLEGLEGKALEDAKRLNEKLNKLGEDIQAKTNEEQKAALETKLRELGVEQQKFIEDYSAAAIEKAVTELKKERKSSNQFELEMKWMNRHTKEPFVLDNAVEYGPEHAAGTKIHLPRSDYGMKYVAQATAVPGGAVEAMEPWAMLSVGNPYRAHVNIRQLSEGSTTVPAMAPITFMEQAARNVAGNADGRNRVAAGVGALSSDTVNLENWVAETWVADPALADIMGLRMEVAEEMLRQAGTTQGAVIFKAIKDNTDTGTVTSGTNDAKPAPADALDKAIAMIEALPEQYHVNASFHFGNAYHGSLMRGKSGGAGGGYDFDPTLGVRTIEGFPVYINGHYDRTDAAGNLYATFGDHRRAVTLAERSSMIIADEYRETRPGSTTFFSSIRTAAFVRDHNALIRLIEGA